MNILHDQVVRKCMYVRACGDATQAACVREDAWHRKGRQDQTFVGTQYLTRKDKRRVCGGAGPSRLTLLADNDVRIHCSQGRAAEIPAKVDPDIPSSRARRR